MEILRAIRVVESQTHWTPSALVERGVSLVVGWKAFPALWMEELEREWRLNFEREGLQRNELMLK